MLKKYPFIRRIGAIACALVLLFATAAPAQAAMVGTKQVLDPAATAETRAELVELTEREAVQRQLAELGVTPEEARVRIQHLTDAEVARLEGRLEELPAGSSSVIGAALVVFIVFVVTDVLGATDLFPFIHPIER